MPAIWARMPHQTYRFKGKDAKSFLQGQLTQDINAITPNACHYGAYCNHKGRMYANALLVNDHDDMLIRLHAEQAESVIKRLRMFVLRADVTVDVSEYLHIGMNAAMADSFCQSLSVSVPEPFQTVSKDDVILCALPNGYYEAFLTAESSHLPFFTDEQQNDDAIEALRISGANFHIIPETNEVLLPQQTPLEEWGGISYTKGCYVGQEIIARNKYRGKVRKKLAVAVSEQPIDISINDDVLNDHDKKIGQVIEYRQDGGKTVCLAILGLEYMGQTVSLGNQNVVFHTIQSI